MKNGDYDTEEEEDDQDDNVTKYKSTVPRQLKNIKRVIPFEKTGK